MATEPEHDVSIIDLDPFAPQSTRSKMGVVCTFILAGILGLGLLLLWLTIPRGEEGIKTQAAQFFGNFHPIAVHAPITLLVVALLFEVIGRTPLARSWRGLGGPLLWLGTIGAVFAVLLGYAAGIGENWLGSSFDLHQWTGIGVAVTALLATLFRSVDRQGLSILALVVSSGFISVAGYMGGELTYGSNHLIKDMPEPWKAALGLAEKEDATASNVPEDPVIFTDLIVPIFERSCIECHGPEKCKGELRMDIYSEMFIEGDSGYPGLVAGDADESEIYIRLTLDHDDDEFMPPPKDGDPLSEDEMKVIQWWIGEGKASDTALVSEVETPEGMQSSIDAVLAIK